MFKELLKRNKQNLNVRPSGAHCICPTAMFLLMKYTQSKFQKSSLAPIFDSQTDGESDDIDAHHPPLVSPENNNAHDPHHRHHDHDHDHKHDADAEAEAEGYAGAEGEAESEAEAEAAYGTGNKSTG